MACSPCAERLRALADKVDGTGGFAIAEMSNPGPIGKDTGVEFVSPKTGQRIRVIAHANESMQHAVTRVKARHGA